MSMDYMARALDLAERAKGFCNPNPAVGAVLVNQGRVVGEGFTQPRGQAHAEIVALDEAGSGAAGSTLFVSLEPCVHQGWTGPCTERLIEAGVAEVHCSMIDPSSWVYGRGRDELERSGIKVVVGERAEAAGQLNQDYVHWVTTGQPYVTAKYAMSLDGKIATRTGSSRWISGPSARQMVGQMRSRADAVLVGGETVLKDDPSLTARALDDSLLPRQPLRVVLDSQGRTPASARVVSGLQAGQTLIATTPAGAEVLSQLASETVEIWVGRPDPAGRVAVAELMSELGRRSFISVLVEPGGTLLASLLELQLVQEIVAFIAPKLVGGAEAPTPVAGRGIDEMAAALSLVNVRYERVGSDLLVRGQLSRCAPDGTPPK